MSYSSADSRVVRPGEPSQKVEFVFSANPEAIHRSTASRRMALWKPAPETEGTATSRTEMHAAAYVGITNYYNGT